MGNHDHSGGCHRGVLTIDGPINAYEWMPSMTVDPVRGRAWSVSEGVYRALVVEGDEGLIAFDTFWSPGAAKAYRSALQRVFPRKEIHTVIYTHDHLDHTGFAADLAPDASTILAHELTAQMIQARPSDGQLPPTQTWRGERVPMEIDGASFELIYPGPTHGVGNTAVYFPEDRFLHMVDTAIVGANYTVVPDYAWTSWIPNTKRLLGLDWDLYVPGHFWNLSRREFEADGELWDATASCALEALRAGVDVDDYADVKAFAYKTMDAEWGSRTFRFDEFIVMNVMRHMLHYLTGGWGLYEYEPYSTEPFHTTKNTHLMGSLA